MVLYVYGPDTQRPGRGVVFFENFISLRWRRKYFEPGEIELHAAPTQGNLALFAPGSIISREDCTEAAEVTGIEVTANDLKVTGNMLSHRLSNKVVDQFDQRASAGELMCEAARLAGFEQASGSMGDELAVQANFKNALAIVKAVAKASGLGYRVVFRALGDYLFEVYQGVSSEEEGGEPLVFSNEGRNLMNVKYTYSEAGYANTAVVTGEKKDGAQTMARVSLPGAEGEPVREIYVNASDLQRPEGQSDADYTALLRQRGMEKLMEHVRVQNFEADVAVTPDHIYRRDWDLGNLVRIVYEPWAAESLLRITEIEEIYEKGAVRVIPVFGDPTPEALDLGGN